MGSKLSRTRNSDDGFRANVNPNSTASRTTHGSTNSGTEQSSRSRSLVLRHHYRQLHRAAIQENWQDAAQVFRNCHQHAADAKKWALHFAIRTGKANDYLKHLLNYLNIDELRLEENGETALSIAATVGSVEVVKLLVEKDPDLPDHRISKEQWPLNVAAKYGNKKMVSYLSNVTTYPQGSNNEDPLGGEFAQHLVENLINSALYGAALEALKRCSSNRSTNTRQMCSLLTLLVNQPFAFRSTSSLSLFQQLLYFVMNSKLEDRIRKFQIYLQDRAERAYTTGLSMNSLWYPNIQPFLSNPEYNISSVNYWWWYQNIIMVLTALAVAWWNTTEKLVSWLIKEGQEIKLMHDQATELVKYLCELLNGESDNESEVNFKKPFLLAAELGMMEIVQEILKVCPSAIGFTEGEDNILVLAVKNRNEGILCLENYLDKFKEIANNFKDRDGNNILHIAGRSAPKDKLNSICSPDLQVRSESKWLKKVGKLVPDQYYDMKNRYDQTPMMIFEEQHRDLLAEGEKWMKSIAKPCRNVASLIMVVVFLSMITLYYYDILSEDGFKLVRVADSFVVVFSFISLFIFTAILRFSYAYHNFHRILRLTLFFGLGALCLSLIFMVIASVATLYRK